MYADLYFYMQNTLAASSILLIFDKNRCSSPDKPKRKHIFTHRQNQNKFK